MILACVLISLAIFRVSGQDVPDDCAGCISAEADVNVDEMLEGMFAEHDKFDLKQETVQFAEQMGVNVRFSEFKPIRFRSQTVAGVNYFVRVKTSDSFTDVYVYQDWDTAKAPHVVAADFDRKSTDPIDIFGFGPEWGDNVYNSPREPIGGCPGCRSNERKPSRSVLSFFQTYGEKLRKLAQGQVQEQGLNRVFVEFTPVRFADQWVAGRKLFVKVRVGKNTFIDIEVFEPPLRSEGNAVPEIWGLKPEVKEEDPIDNFDNSVLV